jgi:hypothetical protein
MIGHNKNTMLKSDEMSWRDRFGMYQHRHTANILLTTIPGASIQCREEGNAKIYPSPLRMVAEPEAHDPEQGTYRELLPMNVTLPRQTTIMSRIGLF